MTDFLPADFICSEATRGIIMQKLAAFEAIADELPVYIIHDLRDLSVVYMSPVGLQQLGITLAEVRKMEGEYFAKFFNMEDVGFYLPKFVTALQAPDAKQWYSFFQQVATGTNKSFEWYLSASRLFIQDEAGIPLLSLTFALQLNPDHHLAEKAERLMRENLLLKTNHAQYAMLTKRERELLGYIASGETTADICQRIHISEKTINTHRRNIKRKINAKTYYDMVRFAQAFNLV